MSDGPTPETDKIAKFLLYENADKRDYELRQHARRLERDRDEQFRLLGMSAERECDLRGKLDRERALANRLAEELEKLAWLAGHEVPNEAEKAIAAWKEARND